MYVVAAILAYVVKIVWQCMFVYGGVLIATHTMRIRLLVGKFQAPLTGIVLTLHMPIGGVWL
jgi:hypothetical protein